MFYCFITILSTIFYNRLICLSFVIEIFNFQTVPGTKQHRFMFNLTFYAMPIFIRHQKDSGSWSIHKGENFFNENCILGRHGQSSVRKAVLHVDAPSSLLLALQCTEVRFARFQWIYYYGNNKSTGKETCKTHYCALYCLHGLLCCYAISVSYFYVYQMSWKILSNNGI